MGDFKYRTLDRLLFYGAYFWYKAILPFEVKSPRMAMWLYELAYTAHKFRDYTYCLPWTSRSKVIATRFGTFMIRPGTADAANVSPAFERRDLNRLFRLLESLLSSGKKVLFLDVGGDIGTYSIAVANRFKGNRLKILCFEPVPDSCALIRENISCNGLNGRVELIEMALMDDRNERLVICLDKLAPGSSSVRGNGDELIVHADTLDHIMAGREGETFDAVIMKIDVEGVEECVLNGASGFLAQCIETHLMVEDFIDKNIVGYLERSGWSFQGKLTDYNSWWRKN